MRRGAGRQRGPYAGLPTREGPHAIGISIGVGSMREGDPDIGTMIARADAAMYEEKRAGTRSFLAVA